MRSVSFQGSVVEFDEGKSAPLIYEASQRDWCQCDGCTNRRMTRTDFTPVAQREVLRGFGLDYTQPLHSAFARNQNRVRPHCVRTVSCWFLYGRISSGTATPRLNFDSENWMIIDPDRERLNRLIGNLNEVEPFGPGLIYLVTSNCIPRLFGEVCSFRSERGSRCSRCHSEWHKTGYLRHRSLIPSWFGLPDLKRTLLDRKARVLVKFCSHCGMVEHEIVPDKPPFRRKSPIARSERRLVRAINRKVSPGRFEKQYETHPRLLMDAGRPVPPNWPSQVGHPAAD